MRKAGEYRRLERVIKGFANHRRLQILDLLKQNPGLSVEQISERLRIGYVNTSDHLRKMAIAGLLYKYNEGNMVRHRLTARSETISVFCKKLE